MTQWVICRKQKRPERVNRSKQQVEALAIPAAPTEIAEQSRPLRLRISLTKGEALTTIRKFAPLGCDFLHHYSFFSLKSSVLSKKS
ncbi:hypothetical protein, partial [Aristaeella hokkaidonensis]|uniref:hypothetical protein n=1 Tax=Aristaeella hokkaidonensis TaxID=3046382 RepID=UPI0024B6E71B